MSLPGFGKSKSTTMKVRNLETRPSEFKLRPKGILISSGTMDGGSLSYSMVKTANEAR